MQRAVQRLRLPGAWRQSLFFLLALSLLWLALPAPVDEVTVSLAAGTAPLHSHARVRPARISLPPPAPLDVRGARARAEAAVQARLQAQRRAWIALHQEFWLHGAGTQLYTAWNTRITLKAINWYGFEYLPFVPGGLDRASLDSILRTLHDLGFNALRITFADATVESNPVVKNGLDANPQLRGLHALDIMQRILERAHRFGLRVILCNSRSEAGMGPEIKTGLWYTNRYPESAWQADWVKLVERFRNESAFVGADLRNEPHIIGSKFDLNAYFTLGPLWGSFNGTYYRDRDWHYAAETLGNMLLRLNPRLLIIVEGVQMYLDPDRQKLTGALWGSNLIGVQYDPVQLSRPSQLVYSVHEYGPKMYPASWFNPGTTYVKLAHRWNRHWGYLLHAPRFMQAPIFIGEFGTCDDWHSCISDPAHPASQGFWFTSFVQYMKAHSQVSWAYWALNPEGPFYRGEDDFYSLMTPDWHGYHPLLTYGLAPLLQEPNG
jgi:endoglucanase